MKKFLFLLLLSIAFYSNSNAQEVVPLVSIDGDTFFVDVSEYVEVASKSEDIYTQIVQEAKDNPGKSVVEWISFIFIVIMGSGGVTYVTQLIKVAKNLVSIFSFKMGVRMFVAALSFFMASLVSYYISGSFLTDFTIMLWGSFFMVSTGIYVAFFKKGDAE